MSFLAANLPQYPELPQDITTHASQRLAQRGIPRFMVELLDRYGREIHQDGSTVVLFDKEALKQLRRDLGRRAFPLVEQWRQVYLVRSNDGCIITVGHRRKRLHA